MLKKDKNFKTNYAEAHNAYPGMMGRVIDKTGKCRDIVDIMALLIKNATGRGAGWGPVQIRMFADAVINQTYQDRGLLKVEPLDGEPVEVGRLKEELAEKDKRLAALEKAVELMSAPKETTEEKDVAKRPRGRPKQK